MSEKLFMKDNQKQITWENLSQEEKNYIYIEDGKVL